MRLGVPCKFIVTWGMFSGSLIPKGQKVLEILAQCILHSSSGREG